MGHIPVLLNEVLDYMAPLLQKGNRLIDGTFGGGGYSQAFLEAGVQVLGIDRDPAAVQRGAVLHEASEKQLILQEGTYAHMGHYAAQIGWERVQGVVLDIGVSSFQIDEAKRGFSYRFDGPLDMRMGADGPTAADVLQNLDEGELARVFKVYGEERHARRIARAIKKHLETDTDGLETTSQLAALLERVIPQKGRDKHPARRVFQALRIYVNDELGELEKGLQAGAEVLAPGGRLAVVSFHSLEDRCVKEMFARLSSSDGALKKKKSSSFVPLPEIESQTSPFRIVTRKAVRPGEEELRENPRARSACLRVLERVKEGVSCA